MSDDAGYEILSIDDLDRYTTPQGSQVLRPLRRRIGFHPFGVNVWVGEAAGDHVVEPHREPEGTEELYVVVRGRAALHRSRRDVRRSRRHARARAACDVP